MRNVVGKICRTIYTTWVQREKSSRSLNKVEIHVHHLKDIEWSALATQHVSPVSISELQNKLMAVESEMTTKSKEIQSLHSSLKDSIFFKEQEQQKVMQLEQKVRQLLEAAKHTMQPDDQLQEQVQVSHCTPQTQQKHVCVLYRCWSTHNIVVCRIFLMKTKRWKFRLIIFRLSSVLRYVCVDLWMRGNLSLLVGGH